MNLSCPDFATPLQNCALRQAFHHTEPPVDPVIEVLGSGCVVTSQEYRPANEIHVWQEMPVPKEHEPEQVGIEFQFDLPICNSFHMDIFKFPHTTGLSIFFAQELALEAVVEQSAPIHPEARTLFS